MKRPLWTPSKKSCEAAQITLFRHKIAKEYAISLPDYQALFNWSIENPSEFWKNIWEESPIIHSAPYTQVLQNPTNMMDAHWFEGAQLNFAENLLRYRDNAPAIIFYSETGDRQQLSYKELYSHVAKLAHYLRTKGVKASDRVVALMPNLPETVIAMLAVTSIGAIWSSCSPDFGVQGVLDRFVQIEPKLLFSSNSYSYKGKTIDCGEKIDALLENIPSIKEVLLTENLQTIFSSDEEHELIFEQLPFNHPVYIMYSSGTTGMPKCIVHGAGGTLLEQFKELKLHVDLQREDNIFYFTTCGWMMWNWLLSSLGIGATVVLYEGAPLHPKATALFDMAEECEISVFGTSAKYLSAIEKAGVTPIKTHDLHNLRMICSTGSPLLSESFDYVYTQIKQNLCLASISGGTDILGCFALGNPTAPVYRGELQARSLGMHVQIFNNEGKPIHNSPGELVCTNPFPSMPVFFWNDSDKKKYHASYFETFEGVWRHGDWAKISDQDGMIIYGRSDTTLNPGGVRIGSAEIYRQVDSFSEIQESLVVGQQINHDERMLLFVILAKEETLSENLSKRIKERLRSECSPRHVPAKIIDVADIPRTVNGKISELAVKNAINGLPIKNRHALANPEALDYFLNLHELQKQ